MSKLYPCVYCTEDGYCKKYSDEYVTSWCVQGPCKDEKPSNADRIRSMNDEELAEWLTLCLWGENREVPFLLSCTVEKWLDWLKQEVTDNSTT